MDKINGYGKMIYEDGTEYEGEWVDGFKQGKGVERNNIKGDGAKEFRGLFEENMKIGPDWESVKKYFSQNTSVVYRPSNLKYRAMDNDE